MSDSSSNKSGKVRIMYVRSEDKTDNPRPGDRHRRNENDKPGRRGAGEKNSRNKPQNPRDLNPRHARENPSRLDNDNERNPWRKERPERARQGEAPFADSPWKTVSRAPDDDATPDHGGITGKSQIDPAQIRRQRQEETRVYGENACQALFNSRPDAIVRAWFLQEVTPRFREALRWMAANRKAYHVVDEDELTKASGTDHHGGVCFLIKKRQGMDAQAYLAQAGEKDCVLALEEVGNPHNLGGIMRTGAHFGVKGVLIQDPALLESGAAVRTAEGGAEHLKAIQTDELQSTLSQFRKAGYTIVTMSSHKGHALSQTTLPEKAVLVLGHEGDGLSDGIRQQGDIAVSIDGTGNVESLNISVATGILLAEWWRQHRA